MKNLMRKEIKLSASPLSFLFLLFSLMTMIPGYPILVGAFFVCFGVFQSFQNGCLNNDIMYTVLLPIKKTDAVKAKYGFTMMIQMISFVMMAVFTIFRMTVLADAAPYTHNAMMNANPFFLAGNLLVFTLFNWFFVGGFFKTAYKYGKPFLLFSIASFLFIMLAETLHHIPGLESLNNTHAMGDAGQWLIFVTAILVYFSVSILSCKISIKRFEAVDM